jgi:hypothetical protein
MKRYIIGDIETMKEYFLCMFYETDTKKWISFEINKNINNIEEFIKYIDDNKDFYFVYYNGLRFDCQIIEYIIRNYNNFHDLSNLDITLLLSNKAQEIIKKSRRFTACFIGK